MEEEDGPAPAEEFELPQAPEDEQDEGEPRSTAAATEADGDAAMAEALPAGDDHNYRCLKCGLKCTLRRRDAVKCECGYRILLKLPQTAVSHPISAR